MMARLVECRDGVDLAVESALSTVCAAQPGMRTVLPELLELDAGRTSVFRLLPFGFTCDHDAAVLVGVISRICWAVSAALTAGGEARTAAELCAGAAARMISGSGAPALVQRKLVGELPPSSPQAVNAELDDVREDWSWARAMAVHAAKAGAAYGRDLAMTAVLVGEPPERVPAWRAFGRLYGVVRQMAEDRERLFGTDGGAVDGGGTFLLAHAAEVLPPERRADLLLLHERARDCTESSAALCDLLLSAEVAPQYNKRLADIRAKLASMLGELVISVEQRALARWLIDTSVRSATLYSRGPDVSAALEFR